MNIKVSIVVPCYNVEAFVDKCLESITSQSYNNIEIICVNDGSKDKTLDILKKWRDKDKRIIVVDQVNGGLSDARNSARKHITGEYVTFVDSDDWISTNFIEAAIKNIESNTLLISKVKKVPGKYVKVSKKYNKKKMYSKCWITAWGKVYKTIEWKSDFEKKMIFEDEANTPLLMKQFKKAKRFDGTYFYRTDNQNSIVKTKWSYETYMNTLNFIRNNCNDKYSNIRVVYFSLKVYSRYPDKYKELLRNQEIKKILKSKYGFKIVILRIMLVLGMKKTIRKLI